MNISALLIVMMILISFGRDTALHGQKKKKKYNGWVSFIATIVAFVLYYYAGIFESFNL